MASVDTPRTRDSNDLQSDAMESKTGDIFISSDSVQTLRLFVPGRICLFGEHSDWAASYRKVDPSIASGRCIVCGTNQGLYANVQAHSSKLIVIARTELGDKWPPFECEMERETLYEIASGGGIFSYIAGVAYQVLLKHRVGGLILNNYSTTLPLKKGLSSSAAICVLVARAFNKMYDLKLTTEGEMEFAYLGITPFRI